MRTYELYLHLDPSLGDAGADKALKDIETFLTKAGGTITNKDNKGILRLASPIDNSKDSIQVILMAQAEPSSIKEFRRQVSLMDSVLRIGIFTVEAATALA